MLYSISNQLKGSHKNSFRVNPYLYCYGKGTTYGYVPVDTDIITLVSNLLFAAVSPYIFKTDKRDLNNIAGVGGVIILDIDSKLDIREGLFNSLSQIPFSYVVLPTQNHIVGGWKYRVAIPCEGMHTVEDYLQALAYVVERYNIPSVDPASKTRARFFAPAVPLVGQQFKHLEPNGEPFTVTEEVYWETLSRLELLNSEGGIEINKELYPYQDTYSLVFTEEMRMYAPSVEEVVQSSIVGSTLTEVYGEESNSIDKGEFKQLQETGEVCIGDVASSLMPNQRVLCRCPSKELHTDQTDKRYAWLLKTAGSQVRLYCASSHCQEKFGEYRVVSMPEWTEFILTESYNETYHMTRNIFHTVKTNLVRLFSEVVCRIEGAEFTEWHEKAKYVEEVLFSKYLDDNSLSILILMVNKGENGGTQLHNITPAGSRLSTITVVKGIGDAMLSNWFSYIFRVAYRELYEVGGDAVFAKSAVLRRVIEIVVANTSFVKIAREVTHIKPTQDAKSVLKIGYRMNARTESIVLNSFDEPVFQKRAELRKGGWSGHSETETVIGAFLQHWALPRGSVMSIENLPDLLMCFSLLNLYSEGKANQRHTAFVITCPPSYGKTSLIRNFFECGISNSDKYMADVFGFSGLYPQGVEELKGRLWVTGDELNNKTMARIDAGTLLGNLTRLDVTVNIKNKIDQQFSAYAKVLWGARAYEAISSIDQAYELKSRLYAMEFDEEESGFLALCKVETGYVDNIIQLWLCERYFAWKEWVRGLSVDERLSGLNKLKDELMKLYSGTIEAVVDGEVIQTKTDKDRALEDVIDVFLRWYENCKVGNYIWHSEIPTRLTTRDMKLAYCEYRMKTSSVICPELCIPTISMKGRSLFMELWEKVCISVVGEKKAYYLTHSLNTRNLEELLIKLGGKKFKGNPYDQMYNREVKDGYYWYIPIQTLEEWLDA